jgi:UDP-N-acetylglucosamine 4,6-dehydratase/5-epimerase
VDLGDRYAIQPSFVEYARRPQKGTTLDEGFSYSSDTNDEWLRGGELLAMLDPR